MKKRLMASVLVVAMLLTVLTGMTFAADTAVSTLAELQAALDAAQAGDTITVSAALTITEDVTLSSDNAVTINAAGAVDLFTVTGGTLTLGSGLTVNSDTSILYATNGAAIVVDGAILNTTGSPYATAYVDNGTITVKSGAINALGVDSNGGEHAALSVKGANAVANVLGGTVSHNASSTVFVRNNGTVNISGGTVITTVQVPAFCAAWANNGGTINMTGGSVTASTGKGLIAATDGTVNLSGGTVTGGVVAHENANAAVAITGGTVNGDVYADDGATLTISGGTFSADVSGYVADGYVQKDGAVIPESVPSTPLFPALPNLPNRPGRPCPPYDHNCPPFHCGTYSVSATASAGGSISPAGTYYVKPGTVVTYTITPSTGYCIEAVYVNGVNRGSSSTITVCVTSDTVIRAIFSYNGTFIYGNYGTTPSKGSFYEKALEMAAYSQPFYADVAPAAWYYENVTWLWERGLTDAATYFYPETNASRCCIVEWIWRMEGRPVTTGVAFTDTTEMSAIWAAANHVVYGYGDNTFGPCDDVTREQLAAIIYRYCMYNHLNLNDRGDLSVFSDASEVSEWAAEAMSWAVGVGILEGRTDGTLDPQGTATRAELAAMLNRVSLYYGL